MQGHIYIGCRFCNNRSNGWKTITTLFKDDKGDGMIGAIIGLVGVVVGSIITITKDVWISRLERRREGSYSAIRLICILEEYANDCIDVVQDDGTAHGMPAGRTENGEEYPIAQVKDPDPLNFPENIAWQSLPTDLMDRTLSLPNKARDTDRRISTFSEYVSYPDFNEVLTLRQEGYAQLGLNALEIADDLRKQFGISVKNRADLKFDWDPKAFLSKEVATFKKSADLDACSVSQFPTAE